MLDGVIARGWRWWSDLSARGRRDILLAALLLFAYGFFQQRPAWNEYSRYDLVRALVEQGTTRIDSFHENTGDKAFYQGHWFSDKAPGTALVGVPVYALLSLSSGLAGNGIPEAVEAVQALAFVESGIATTVLVLLLVRFLAPLVGERWAVGVGLAYGFGSIAFPFATIFFGHALSAAALFASFYVLHGWRRGEGGWRPWLAGALGSVAVITEFSTVIGVAALFLYAVWVGRRAAYAFVLGGIPIALVLAIYNAVSFGSPLSIGYANLAPGGFAEGMSQGILGVSWPPDVETLGDLLIGPRGLVRLAPWFVLAPLGVLAARRREVRAEVIVCATIALVFLLSNAGYYLPFGGWTPGPRFLLPALPFAAVLVALIPAALRFVAVPLMIFAAGVFLVATATMPNAPERYVDPLFELWLPRLASGELAESAGWIRWGLHGFAVLAVFLVGLGFGLVALALSFGRASLAERTSVRAPFLVAVLALAFSFPFPPLAPVAVGWQGDLGPPAVSVVEVDHTPFEHGGVAEIELWARLENRGGAIPSSRTQFTVWRGTDEVVWSAWYGDVPIAAGSRQTVFMTWRPDELSPGTYSYEFVVSDATSGAPYAQLRAGDAISIGP